MTRCQVLAVGAHPDDVEIGAGGTLAHHRAAGYSVGILDLTRGELASNGTVEIREQEAVKAGDILGVEARINLGLPDRGLRRQRDQIERVAAVLRRYRPTIVLAPWAADRHPDHRAAAQLVEEAVTSASLKKIELDGLKPHRVGSVYYYHIHAVESPSLIVDVSAQYELKRQALRAHQSQFFSSADVSTPINKPDFLQQIEQRDGYFGTMIDANFGEAFQSKTPIGLTNLLSPGIR